MSPSESPSSPSLTSKPSSPASDPASEPAKDPIVGIDLGTTNSLVAFSDERGPRVLIEAGTEASPEAAIVPSVVRYESDGGGGVRTVVGVDAAARAVEFPTTTVASAKRLMGRSVEDAQGDLPYLSYPVVAGDHNTARIALDIEGLAKPKIVSPQEVSAEILSALKGRASAALGTQVRRAVVTVPAYFDDAQRQATRDAGRIAGLEVVRIVNEPTAAALAYGIGLDRSAARNQRDSVVAVYDLGGGTFDISILRLIPGAKDDPDATDFFQVIATAGDTRLGGDDVDQSLVALFLKEMGLSDRQTDLPPATRRALLGFARSIKHRLSEETTAQVRIETAPGEAYVRTVTRDEIEALMAGWVDRTLDACDRALRDAKRELAGDAIDRVILVGGSTRVPLVRRRVADKFGVEPYTALDPDQVVALGASVQASILSQAGGDAPASALLLDVIPLSLGIETRGGATAKLIVRNSPAPARATETFTTSVDNQTSIKLNVVQGEREMAEDCRSLGEFELKGLPPMPAGIPQLEVEFLVDANGVLRVSAQEKRSGKRAQLQVTPNHGLTEDEVNAIEAASFEHAEEDMTRRRVVDLIENGRLDLKWIGERFEKHTGDLEPGYRAELEADMKALAELIEKAQSDWRSVEGDALHAAKEKLDRASMRLQEISISASLRADDGGA